jgi:hypothetical protein
MGSPKYKKYPQERKEGNKTHFSSSGREEDKHKILELRIKIRELLKEPENLDKAAALISSWNKRES